MTSKEEKRNYWASWENLQREVQCVIRKLGHFPSQLELREHAKPGINNGISRYHGGLLNVRERMGYENDSKPRGYWRDKDNFAAEARRLSDEYGGHLPPMQQLQRDGHYGIINAAHYHGGLSNLRVMLGEQLKKAPNGHWDWKRVSTELTGITEELGHFPTQKELSDLGRNDLSIAVSRKHGGLLSARKKLGFDDPQEKPAGYWEDWDNFAREMEPLIEKFGRLPYETELRRMGHNSVESAIQRYHGGRKAVRQKLGLKEPKRKPNGHWREESNVIAEVEKIMREYDLVDVPNGATLAKLGYKGLETAIYDYHGGFERLREVVREILGIPSQGKQLENLLSQYAGVEDEQ